MNSFGVIIMDLYEFEKVRNEFQDADVEKKIDIYCTAENLTQEQYRQLLRIFPIAELDRLEQALR